MNSLPQIYARCTAKCSSIWRHASRVPDALKAKEYGSVTLENAATKLQERLTTLIQIAPTTQTRAPIQPVLTKNDPYKPTLLTKSP